MSLNCQKNYNKKMHNAKCTSAYPWHLLKQIASVRFTLCVERKIYYFSFS